MMSCDQSGESALASLREVGDARKRAGLTKTVSLISVASYFVAIVLAVTGKAPTVCSRRNHSVPRIECGVIDARILRESFEVLVDLCRRHPAIGCPFTLRMILHHGIFPYPVLGILSTENTIIL